MLMSLELAENLELGLRWFAMPLAAGTPLVELLQLEVVLQIHVTFRFHVKFVVRELAAVLEYWRCR